jgi:hypothetical protein
MDDFTWRKKVVQTVPLYIEELGREEPVEWIQEQAGCDLGLMQIEYTRCDALNRAFCSGSVVASLWEIMVDEDSGDCFYEFLKGNNSFLHIGLAKRWAAAQSELWSVIDANSELGADGWFFEDEGETGEFN